MPPHNPPSLTLIETHRPVILDYDRSPEPDTPVVFTGAEVVFAAWVGGFIGVVITVALAFVWSWFL